MPFRHARARLSYSLFYNRAWSAVFKSAVSANFAIRLGFILASEMQGRWRESDASWKMGAARLGGGPGGGAGGGWRHGALLAEGFLERLEGKSFSAEQVK